MRINLDLIKSSSHPVRSSWDEDKMEELVQSIREQGLIVPIKVRPALPLKQCRYHGLEWLGDSYPCYIHEDSEDSCPICSRFAEEFATWGDDVDDWSWASATVECQPLEIVYGHRRVEACRQAGKGEIESIVEGMNDADALIQSLIENVQREDVEPLDLTRALQALHK